MIRFEVRPTATDGFRWRLLSRNNRTMAIAPADAENRGDCLAQLQQMWSAAKAREPQLVLADNGSWSWVLLDARGTPVAQSASLYPRRIDCAGAVGRFLDLTTSIEEFPADEVIAEPRRRRPRRRATAFDDPRPAR